jgi:hypothetical protein
MPPLLPGRRCRLARNGFALSALLLGPAMTLAASQEFIREVAETNVNQRYVIESVSVDGVEVDHWAPSRLPRKLRSRLKSLVGERCDMATLEDLSVQIRRELHLRAVSEHLSRGSSREQVRVDFQIERRDLAFDISLPKFLFQSQQGWSGELDASTQFKQNHVTFGILSDGDNLVERYSGITTRFDSAPLGSDKIRLGLLLEDYHSQWNAATIVANAGEGLELYRSRWNVAPELTVAAAGGFTVSIGASFEQMEAESPGAAATSANAFTLDAHYGRRIEGGFGQQKIEGNYSLRVATHVLGSTYSYARHLVSMHYEAKSGKRTLSSQFEAGSIEGRAPFFDRFVLGSSSTLRGWDRYELDPLGGSRMLHNELAYGYRIGDGTVEGFYDTGALWQTDRAAILRHSVGVGYKQGVFVLSMAFPVRNGRIEPVFMAGMNY